MTATKYLPRRNMLHISTAHIARETAEALGGLKDHTQAPLFDLVTYTPWSDYGWIFYCGDVEGGFEEEHPDLAEVLAFACERGFDYIKLDCDADIIDDLPKYQWT
jgi:hypothetical protein